MHKVLPTKEYFKDAPFVAADKSITHRAIMLGSIALGKTIVYNALLGEDCLATIDCMRKLGAKIEVKGSTVSVVGAQRLQDNQELYAANSGTTMRLLTGLLSGMGIDARISGDASLSKRPMGRVSGPLTLMGADVKTNKGYAPIQISKASLKGIEYDLPIASAQIKSAILFAGLNAEGQTTINQKQISRDHSEIMLKAMGADICQNQKVLTIKKSTLKAIETVVPADISSAAFAMVRAAIADKGKVFLKNVGINPTRTGILKVFDLSGVQYELSNLRSFSGENTADITVFSSTINPFEIGGDIIPALIDEIPIICVLACFARGRTIIKNAEELKVKESNRIELTANLLRLMGGDITTTDDGMIIEGKGGLEGGAQIDPKGDHRLAMALAIAGAASKLGVLIEDEKCVEVSYPGFFDLL